MDNEEMLYALRKHVDGLWAANAALTVMWKALIETHPLQRALAIQIMRALEVSEMSGPASVLNEDGREKVREMVERLQPRGGVPGSDNPGRGS